jgi:hypothetical protein
MYRVFFYWNRERGEWGRKVVYVEYYCVRVCAMWGFGCFVCVYVLSRVRYSSATVITGFRIW